MRKHAIVGLLILILIGIIGSALVSATITITEVELDDDELSSTSTNFIRDVDRGDNFGVKVHLVSDSDVDDVQIEAAIRGYDHKDLMDDITDVFNMKKNVTYVKKLSLELRSRAEQDKYRLRVRADDRAGETTQKDFFLQIDAKRHLLRIKDVVFSPDNEVKAGRALLTSVRVENMGDSKEEGIKVMVNIPKLGISASDFIDELERSGDDDDETTSEEIFLRIPECAKPATYDAKIEVIYDDGDEKISRILPIEVAEGDACGEKESPRTASPETIVTLGTESQEITQGSSAVYPLTITNKVGSSKTYLVTIDGVDAFGSAAISPSNVLTIPNLDTKTAYVTITANKGIPVGERMFNVAIKSEGVTLKQIPLKTTIKAEKVTQQEAGSFSSLKRGLEIGLVVLVVLLVIIGLIIGFNKLKGSEEDEEPGNEEGGRTYY